MVKRTRARRRRSASPRSLKSGDAFKDFVLGQLDAVDQLAARAMFGGWGLYCRGRFFGIIARDVLYLKVDESNRERFVRAGMEPFRPYLDRAGAMRYYAVPVSVLESAIELEAWVRSSIAAAERAAREPV